MILIEVPFGGFYNSIYSSEIDIFEDMKREALEDEGKEYNQEIDYRKTYEAIAKKYIHCLSELLPEQFNNALTFESLQSPREYNFSNDRIFSHATNEFCKWLCKYLLKNSVYLSKRIYEYFKPRDGFFPHYSFSLNDWNIKAYTKLDYNQLGFLLETYLIIEHGEFWEGDIEMQVCDTIHELFVYEVTSCE